MLSARERSLARERLLYEGLLDALNERPRTAEALRGGAVANSTCWPRFAERAQALDWSRPQLTRRRPGMRIERGRHPVVEAVRDEPFEPNDLRRCDDGRRACW